MPCSGGCDLEGRLAWQCLWGMLAWRAYTPCIQVSCLEGHPREPGTPRIFASEETIETGLGCVYPSCGLYISSLGARLGSRVC